ncbi:fra a 1-associated protein [Pistacia vera]|uniref:fra a 1-associated protein n=1 Tax=Pistacia vera TaxID=55513 RepID=UPI001263D6D9|nr:fra a 1-associated protein [Pistacia vera]
MGWVWRDEDDADYSVNSTNGGGDYSVNSSNGGGCATRTVVRSQCRTEEVEPGKFVRKCEKTEEVLRNCIGKPVEVIKSNKEYTEDDVTEQVMRGSYPSGSLDAPFDFPGLRNDIDSIEHHFFGGISRFFEAAEDMKNHIFDAFGYDSQSPPSPYTRRGVPFEGNQSPSSPYIRRGVPIEGRPEMEASPKLNQPDSKPENFDFSSLAKDV